MLLTVLDGRPLLAAVPAQVVCLSVLVVLAVGIVALLVVCHQVGQGEACRVVGVGVRRREERVLRWCCGDVSLCLCLCLCLCLWWWWWWGGGRGALLGQHSDEQSRGHYTLHHHAA
jgi:hypothetical protein